MAAALLSGLSLWLNVPKVKDGDVPRAELGKALLSGLVVCALKVKDSAHEKREKKFGHGTGVWAIIVGQEKTMAKSMP